MRLRLPKKRKYRIFLYVVAVFVIILALDLLGVRLDRRVTVAWDTTRITAPLRPDGTPDYLQYLHTQLTKDITPDNNAAVLLVQILGITYVPPESRPAFCRDLGIPIPSAPPPFIPFADFYRRTHPGDELLPDVLPGRAPWKPSDYPESAAWIHENDPALDQLVVATQRPRYFMPFVVKPDSELVLQALVPMLGLLRSGADALEERAMLKLQKGDIDGAWQDLQAVHRLARLMASNSCTAVEQLVAMTIEAVAADGDTQIALAPDLSAEQARRCIADLQPVDSLNSLINSIDTLERFSLLSDLCIFSRRGTGWGMNLITRSIYTGNQPPSNLPTWPYAFIPVNYNAALRRANAAMDQVVAAGKAPSYPARETALRRAADALDASRPALHFDISFDPAGTFIATLTPNYEGAFELQAGVAERLDLARIAFALAAYHAEHHAYPDTLAPLLFAYLPAIPQDRFADAPLIYRPSADGYLVYSIGPNLKDDGGRDRTTSKAGPAADDLSISLPPLLLPAPATTSAPADVR